MEEPEYMPLMTVVDSGESEGDIGKPLPRYHHTNGYPTLTLWTTIVVSLVAILSGIVLYNDVAPIRDLDVDLYDPRLVASLRKLEPYPNLELREKIQKTKAMPKLWFPGNMVRANGVEPDRIYETGEDIVLSSNDSMFYRWNLRLPANSKCYIDAIVPSFSELVNGNKSYTGSGDLKKIEIWNVSSTNPRSLKRISWNSRPNRISLLGTVAFIPGTSKKGYMDGKELKPPTPLFECGGKSRVTVEIACRNCQLELQQVFSDPPLGFDLQHLG